MPADLQAPPNQLPDARPLHRLIGRTRRLLRSSWVATGLGISLGLGLLALSVLAVLDLFVPMTPITLPFVDVVVPVDPVLRCVSLVLIVVPTSLAFLHGVVRPLCRRLAPTHVARRIEAHLPGIHNRLVSAIDLEKKADSGTVSPVFLRRLLTEALERARTFRPRMILDLVSLRNAGLAVAVAAVVSLGAWGLFGDRLPTALARIFMPLADIPPASGVAYDVQPGTAPWLRNEDIPFTVRVTQGEAEALYVEMYGQRGTRPKRFPLKADRNDGNLWRAVVDGASLGEGFKNGFDYRVYGGGTWSRQQRITLVDRPVIAGVRAAVYFPKYMKVPQPQPVPESATLVTGPYCEQLGEKKDGKQYSEVEVTVKARGDVDAGTIQLLAPHARPIPLEKQVERAWFEDKVPSGTTTGGSWEWTTLTRRPVHTEKGSYGLYGHWFEGDPVGLAVGKGDVLYAYVYLPAQEAPLMVALEWNDGKRRKDGSPAPAAWNHRAFWGSDLLKDGKPGTPSRFRAGDLPAAGRWVRLEVPAARVGLEGEVLRGVAFKMYGGQASWGRTGTVQVLEPSVKVVESYPMKRIDDEHWSGRFPLRPRSEADRPEFRVELTSSQGFPSKEMKGIGYRAVPDKPPYASLERRGSETVLARPAAVPLSISAFDDFGLDHVRLLVRDQAGGEHRSRTLWSAGNKPRTSLALEAPLTEAASLKLGGGLRYLIEAQDTAGQTFRTQEFIIRVASDANAADNQLAAFDKMEDARLEQLARLIAEQKKIKGRVDVLNKEYAALDQKLREAEAKIEDRTQLDPKTGKPVPVPAGPKLNPEEMKRLAELQKELAKLAGDENRNAETARQVNEELKKSIENARNLDLLPKAVAEQMSATQRLFDRMVAKALKDLAKDFQQGSDPKAGKPDLADLKQKSDRVDKELEGIKDRLDALSKARKDLKDDLEKTLKALRDKMAKEDAKLSARDLEQLKDFINKLREQLKAMKGKQDDAAGDTERAQTPEDVKKAKAKQEDLEKELKQLLEKAKKLLEKGDRDKPEFPDAPFRADDKEEKVPPREQDSDEPLPMKKDKSKEKDRAKDDKDGKGKDRDKKKDDDEDEPKFMPRLGGPRQKMDPRFKDKQRPMKKKGKEKGDKEKGDKEKGDADKGDLQSRQNENSRDLDAADRSLESDQNSLDNLLEQIQQAMKGQKGKKGKDGKEGENEGKDGQPSSSAAEQLRQLMQSQAMREARAMAAAAQALGRSQPQRGPRRPEAPPQSDEGNVHGGDDTPGGNDSNLGKLDPTARAIILKMPPSRYREELIRGLNEQGPEAYRAFIQDYFKRLTQTKK